MSDRELNTRLKTTEALLQNLEYIENLQTVVLRLNVNIAFMQSCINSGESATEKDRPYPDPFEGLK